jgi:hypothetical protein
MNRTSRLAAPVLVCGVLGLAGVGLAAGTAQAAPGGPYQSEVPPVVLTGWGVELGFCGLTGFGY